MWGKMHCNHSQNCCIPPRKWCLHVFPELVDLIFGIQPWRLRPCLHLVLGCVLVDRITSGRR